MNGCRSRWNFTNITNPVEGVSVKSEFIVFLGNHLKCRSNCSLAVCNYFSDEHYDNFLWNIYSSSFFLWFLPRVVSNQFNWIKTPNFLVFYVKICPFHAFPLTFSKNKNKRLLSYTWYMYMYGIHIRQPIAADFL